MISDKVVVADRNNACEGEEAALNMVERTAAFCGFDKEASAQLRKLAEEMITGCAAILDLFAGTVWVETEDDRFTIKLEMEGTFTQLEREALIDLTRDHKNTMPKGFFAKLGVLLSDALTGEYVYPYEMVTDPGTAEVMWSGAELTQMMAEMERHNDPEDKALSEEAKHMLDKLADDIQVSARADHVLVAVMKRMPAKA